MSEAFEILSDAIQEAIDDAKSDSPILKREVLYLDEQPKINIKKRGNVSLPRFV